MSRALNRAADHRSGIKLIECIVVAIIILMILALAAPYLLQNRELARKNQCQQKMVELNRALLEHANATGKLPAGRAEPQPYSALVSLLAFMQAASQLSPVDLEQPLEQSPLFHQLMPELLCPSDPTAQSALLSNSAAGLSSFAMCSGSGSVNHGELQAADGLFGLGHGFSFEEVMNGSSNTVAFSERILGTGQEKPSSRTLSNKQTRWLIWELPDGLVADEVNCRSEKGSWNTERGRSWLRGDYGNALYNHALPPNSAESECSNSAFQSGRFSASSLHGQGVNVSFSDGSIQFMGDAIDQQIWQSLSLRISIRAQRLAE